MVKVTFVAFDGAETVIDVKPGQTVMEAAVKNDLPGIDADCGGACACATCYVFVDEAWFARTGARSETEESMLDYADALTPDSRLSCQIKVTEALEGLIVRLPKSQR